MTLTLIAWISLGIAFASALAISIDELRHPQNMAVMNVVWPVSGLNFSVFAIWAYFRIGRRQTKDAQRDSMTTKGQDTPPTPSQVALGTSHCGAGCTVADVFTGFGIDASGLVLFSSVLWTEYLLDYVAAWALGIAFQYFAIRPMRDDLSISGAIWAAMKADTLSITAFQIGMYAWMALVFYKLFPSPHLTPFDPRYWLMMQIAMICGFRYQLPDEQVPDRQGNQREDVT